MRLLIILTALVLGSSLVLAQERVWNLDHTDQEAYLVFGVPETDDVGVSFWCTLQSGVVRLYVPETDPNLKLATSVDFDLEIAAKIYSLKGKTAVNEESTGTSLEAELKASDPLFSTLRATKKTSPTSQWIFPRLITPFSLVPTNRKVPVSQPSKRPKVEAIKPAVCICALSPMRMPFGLTR